MVKNNIKLLLQKANCKFSVDLRRKDSNQLIQFISNFSFPHYEKRQQRFCALFGLKVLTNEKRGGLKVIAFDNSPFSLFTLKFSNKSIQPSSCERPKTAQRILFLLFANNNCFPITLQCRKKNSNIAIGPLPTLQTAHGLLALFEMICYGDPIFPVISNIGEEVQYRCFN